MKSAVRYAYIAAIAATLLVLWGKGVQRRFPCFMVYLSGCFCAAISYAWGFHPQASLNWWHWHWLAWQPVLILLFAATIAELLWWLFLRIFPEEARLLMGFALCLGLAGAILIYRSIPSDSGMITIVSEIRRYFDLAAACALLAGCGWVWIRPPEVIGDTRRHGIILTIFAATNAAAEITQKTSSHEWRVFDMLAYLISALCLVAWSVAMRHADRPRPA